MRHDHAMAIRLFLVDDHELVLRGLRELVAHEDDIEVVGEATTVELALARVPSARADVAVLDVRLPDGSGVELCRELRERQPSLACLMLTSYADDEAELAAIMAGAAGYVLKQIRGADLVGAIRAVAGGGINKRKKNSRLKQKSKNKIKKEKKNKN
jgi:two-component system response regulator DevR